METNLPIPSAYTSPPVTEKPPALDKLSVLPVRIGAAELLKTADGLPVVLGVSMLQNIPIGEVFAASIIDDLTHPYHRMKQIGTRCSDFHCQHASP
jgi:hypothetical protein